jgi:hypothetical protein
VAWLEQEERLARLAALGLATDPAARLAQELGAGGWAVPGQRRPRPEPEREPGTPPWWHGDEEASQSFLAAVGLRLE